MGPWPVASWGAHASAWVLVSEAGPGGSQCWEPGAQCVALGTFQPFCELWCPLRTAVSVHNLGPGRCSLGLGLSNITMTSTLAQAAAMGSRCPGWIPHLRRSSCGRHSWSDQASGWMAFCPSELTWPPGHSCLTSLTKSLSGAPCQGLLLEKANKVYSKGNKRLMYAWGWRDGVVAGKSDGSVGC